MMTLECRHCKLTSQYSFQDETHLNLPHIAVYQLPIYIYIYTFCTCYVVIFQCLGVEFVVLLEPC